MPIYRPSKNERTLTVPYSTGANGTGRDPRHIFIYTCDILVHLGNLLKASWVGFRYRDPQQRTHTTGANGKGRVPSETTKTRTQLPGHTAFTTSYRIMSKFMKHHELINEHLFFSKLAFQNIVCCSGFDVPLVNECLAFPLGIVDIIHFHSMHKIKLPHCTGAEPSQLIAVPYALSYNRLHLLPCLTVSLSHLLPCLRLAMLNSGNLHTRCTPETMGIFIFQHLPTIDFQGLC